MTPAPPPETAPAPDPGPDPAPRGLLARAFGWLDSVTLGIWLLVLLFVYSTVGSAGYPRWGMVWNPAAWTPVRTKRWFEMTEFEWFHWWPFDLLIGLICLNLAVVTVRRIRLNAINAGVWMIHTGILVLCAGSVWYFGTKVEGDAPVVRRQVVIRTPDGETGAMRAIPGAATEVGGWRFSVTSTTPDYTLLTEGAEGVRDFAVTVSVTSPGGARFLRQLLADHPEHTEDVVPSGDPEQPMARAVKVLGRPLVDEELELALDFLPTEHFYLANWVQKSWALYLREVRADGTRTPWAQRPLEGMPLFNDFLEDPALAWIAPGESVPVDPLDARAEAVEPHDPLPDLPVTVTSYLRYAVLEERRVPGGPLDPTATVRLADDKHGVTADVTLVPNHPREQEDDYGVDLVWAATEAERERLATAAAPRLLFTADGMAEPYEVAVREVSVLDRDLPWTPVPGTPYEHRVEFVQDLGEQGVLASVELRTPERAFRRWVFDPPNAARTMDVSLAEVPELDHDDHDGHDHQPDLVPREHYELDTGIDVAFDPGNRPPPVRLVAGPGEDELGVVLHAGSPQDGTWVPLEVGEVVSLGDERSLVVTNWSARSRLEERPALVPLRERNRDARERRSMVRFRVGPEGAGASDWAMFHHFVFDRSDDDGLRFGPAMRRFPMVPTPVRLADGRTIEVAFSRQRLPLPAPVVLDDFELAAHVGGFSGQTTSIRNWTSHVRFAADDGGWSDPLTVTVNGPAEHEGLWYFQAEWDPPDPGRFRGQPDSAGLNYTVLGVGNRNGVGVQLLGCAISVLGMLYAFYVKPQLLRRRRRGGGDATAARSRARGLASVGVGGAPEEIA